MRDRYEVFDSEIGSDPRAPWAFVTGAVVGALIVVVAMLVVAGIRGGGDGGSDLGRRVAAADASRTAEAEHDTMPSASTAPAGAADPCLERYDAQDEPLHAAASALAQWRVHVGAMNQLVTGSITLRQATAFWNRTRVDAHERLAAYDAAAQSLDGLPRCHKGDTDIADCRVAVHARSHQLALAKRSLATWREHVRHMEMLRHGQLSAQEATQMWLASWHRGVRQLDDYDEAARAAGRHRC